MPSSKPRLNVISGRAVDPHESTARPDITFKRGLLLGIQDIARRKEENNRLVLRKLLVVEHPARVLGPENFEIVEQAEFLDRFNAGVDRIVMPAVGLGEEHDAELLREGHARYDQTE